MSFNSMDQQMYYQPNTPHIPPQPNPQQYYQINGSAAQMANPTPMQPYGHQPQTNMSSPPFSQQVSQPVKSVPPGPQLSQDSLQSQRPNQQPMQTSLGSTDTSQHMNNLSDQMRNVSLSGVQQQPFQSHNGYQTQQQSPVSPVGSQTYTLPQTQSTFPSLQNDPQQRPLQPNLDLSGGQQNWSRPPVAGAQLPQTSETNNWNQNSLQTQQNFQSNTYLPQSTPQPQLPQSQQFQQRGSLNPQNMGQQIPSVPQTVNQMPPMASRFPPPPTQQMQNMSAPLSAPPMPGQMAQQPMQNRYGSPSAMSGAPQQQQQAYQQQQQQSYQQQSQQRLDPEAMPSVVQVIEEDKQKFNTTDILFTTSIPASVPPLVTTINDNEYGIINDGGSARPHHLRPTIYQVPITEDTLKLTNIPLGIVIQPFDDTEVDGKNVVPITNSEIIRCNRCKAYMNPYMRFIDGGRRFQCSLCHHITDCSPSYYANLDHTGQRLDKFNRPELFLGSYEFRATAEYCRNSVLNARRPHIIFAMELTATSKPILYHLAKHLSGIIRDCLPRDPLNPSSSPPLVGFLTYNSKIQIYDIINNGHSHIISDVSSTFPPFTTFLVDPLVHFEQIESFLQSLPTLFANEELETQTVLGPVIEAALLTAQVDSGNWFSGYNPNDNNQAMPVGKIYLFHCTLPNFGTDADTPGRLKPRWTTSPDEIRKLLGTDKEKTILSPASNKYYIGLGQRCVADFASGVELFLFPPINGSYLDVATLGELVRITGTGTIYKYFNDFTDRFLVDLKYSLRSTFAFDAIMKVRTSTGIRPHDYIGNYYVRTTSDIECATINTGCNIAVEIKYDDKLPEDEFVVIQVAILYTALSGERRVRVHNMALSTCQQVADVYRNACCDTTINILLKQTVWAQRNGDKTVQQSKETLINRSINILTAYRRHCAQPGSSLGQLILPEALKLLPMYICGALKCDAIDGGPEMTPDDKAYSQIKLIGAPLSLSQVILYPQLLKIECDDSSGQLRATQIRCSTHKIMDTKAFAYLLENGFYILIYIPNVSIPGQNQFLSAVFGSHVDNISKIQPELGLPKLVTSESNYLNQIIENIENIRKKSMRVYIIRQSIDKLETIFRSFLYEDKKASNNSMAGDSTKLEGPSYVDLLVHLHREIRTQLN
ncbi:protein transport protein Sec24C-like [Oppia nitens]|uniref:protein transport protein Sec24C-like n=1 Tax=Oppia nitens TaxID=1686743 RepID=UPI0023DAEA26|nr:protein transport protein Sec24C-like [Oppia nitens]